MVVVVVPHGVHRYCAPPGNAMVDQVRAVAADEGSGVVVVSAQVGAHHGTVTARASRLRVHTGDGTIIDCGDLGVDAVSFATADPSAGSCGHYYREPSPVARPYRVTVTVVWEITYVTSVGSGTLDALSTSAVIEHPVVEIQTVGAGRAG